MKPALPATALETEGDLIAAALELGAARVPDLAPAELALIRRVGNLAPNIAKELKSDICLQRDPLGDAFAVVRSPDERRAQGATYTPPEIVHAMVNWLAGFRDAADREPMRIVDPGVGSARFLLAAARKFPRAELIGVDVDPVATLIARGNLAAAGYESRSRIILGDYRSLKLLPVDGSTVFVGNPPYVRHHLLDTKWKQWLSREATRMGHSASQLAGLHVHFFLATVLNAKTGDFGCFVTSSEWLDVNYGRLVRDLFLNGLGGRSLTILEPAARPFNDAATTAVISTFEIGSKPAGVRVLRIKALKDLNSGRVGPLVQRARLESECRWSNLTSRPPARRPGFVELGELCRVHRGQVTGANHVWIAGKHSADLPESVLFPCITRARELFAAGKSLEDDAELKQIIDLPVDLSVFNRGERRRVDDFLRIAKNAGAAQGYIAQHRKAWWSVELRPAAPILATYMARRPPVFVRNLAQARHINIAHGLYPRGPLSSLQLDRLAAYLSGSTTVEQGRTYAGGLTKFEPGEMERLFVPAPDLLAASDYVMETGASE